MIPAGDLPRLHLVTDDRIIGRERFLSDAQRLLATGGERLALHLRSHAASGLRLFQLASELAPIAAATGALLLVNDRIDVALAVGAGGVQVGRRGLAVADARRLVGSGGVLGASVHSVEEAAAAFAAGADLVVAGALFSSASHPGMPGSGAGWLRRIPVPSSGRLIGIGGVTEERVGEVLAGGADGVAVIRAIWDAERPRSALLRFVEILYARERIV